MIFSSKGATGVGHFIPFSSWYCSTMADIHLDIPIP